MGDLGGMTPITNPNAPAGGRSRSRQQALPESVRDNVRQFFRDLDGTEPANLYDMLLKTVEKPLLEEVMAHAQNNQSRAAQWLGLNRNTLRKKLLEHGLAD
jgi:Fis family transcriptional regulator, factor for inversion stimulation protein